MACIYCGKEFNLVWKRFQGLEYNDVPLGLSVRVRIYECPNGHVFGHASPAFSIRKTRKRVYVQPEPEKLTLDELRVRKGLKPINDEYIRKNFITTHGKYKSK